MKELTISSHYPTAILHHLRGDDARYRATLSEFGLTPDMLAAPASRISMASYIGLYRRASGLLADEAFRFLEHPLRPGTFALACTFAAEATSIGEALRRFCRFYAVVTDDISLSMRETRDGGIAFEVVLREPERDIFHFAAELFLCIGFRLTSWLAGRLAVPRRVSFSYPPPAHAGEYPFLFPCEHVFQPRGANAVEFDQSWFRQAVLKHPREIRDFIERTPEDLLAAVLTNDSYSNRVYVAINAAEEDRLQQFNDIANELAMSEQTLRRKLRSEGSSFQNLKDTLRRDTALFHLRRDRHTITEISERLGFSTPSAFSRAFKKWTGLSPSAFRNRLNARTKPD